MTRHDQFWDSMLKRHPTACSHPTAISIAFLHRLVDEGRITEQEFEVIHEGINYRIQTLWKQLKELQQPKESRP